MTESRRRPSISGQASLSNLALLVVLCAVQFIDAWDVASMGPALPPIQGDLGMSPTSLQWVVTAYVLGYGGFLLVGGRLADLFDRKRLLLIPLFIFIIASVVGGLATSGELLIAARFVKGVTAAFTAPAALSLLLHTFRDGNERQRVLGIYLAVSSVGFTSGFLFGGLLAAASWRLVLLVPAGLAVILLVVASRVIPQQERGNNDQRESVDVLGALTVTSGLMALVYGVSRASTSGWGDAPTIGVLVAAGVLLASFVQIERVGQAPLLPLGIFTRPGVSRGNATIFLLQGGYVGWQFISTLYLQDVHHWTPLQVGLIFAPGGVITLLTAQRFAGLVTRHGPWPIGSIGMLLMTLGTAWTLTISNLDNVLVFIVASVISGFGYTMAFVAANISAVAGARTNEQGLASGLFIASFQVGSGVVLGVVASVFASGALSGANAYRSGIVVAVVAAVLALVISLAGLSRSSEPAELRQAQRSS